jgi:hypothetical protein
MAVVEAAREIGRLEDGYYELDRVARSTRGKLGAMTDPGGCRIRGLYQNCARGWMSRKREM